MKTTSVISGSYNNQIPHMFSSRAALVSVGTLKLERLDRKNRRRKANGLKPLTHYKDV